MEWEEYENCIAVLALHKVGKSPGAIIQTLKNLKNQQNIYLLDYSVIY